MLPITLIIVPVDRRSGAFEAFLNGRLLCRSATPLLTAARELLHRGHHPATVLEMVHAATPDVIALSAEIGTAAKWTVKETPKAGPRLVPWKAFSRGHVPAPMRSRKRPVPDASQNAPAHQNRTSTR